MVANQPEKSDAEASLTKQGFAGVRVRTLVCVWTLIRAL